MSGCSESPPWPRARRRAPGKAPLRPLTQVLEKAVEDGEVVVAHCTLADASSKAAERLAGRLNKAWQAAAPRLPPRRR